MNLNEKAQLALAVLLILGALGAWWKWLRPKFRRVGEDVRASRDALLGRPAIIDSITREEISPALPGVGQRVSSLELVIGPMSVAIARLADTHERLESHDQRLNALEKASQERALSRTEAIELLRTMDTAMKSTPPHESEG